MRTSPRAVLVISIVVALDVSAVASAHPHPAPRSTTSALCGPPAWHLAPTANHGPETNELLGISATSSSDAWAVGEGFDEQEGHPVGIAMRWDGDRWTDVPIEEVGESSGLFATDALSATDAWAVGFRSLPGGMVSRALIEHWDGAAWEVVSAPVPDPSPLVTTVLTDVLALAPDDAWAVGRWAPVPDHPPLPLIMHWDGSGWTVVDAPEFDTWTELNGVAASGPNDVWFVGSTEVFLERRNAFVERALIEHWDGDGIEVIRAPHNRRRPLNATRLEAAVSVSPTDAWAVGATTRPSGTAVNQSYHWDGERWKRVAVPSPSESLQYLSDVAALSSERVWTVGRSLGDRNYRTFVARWNGERWRQMTSESRRNDSELYGVAVVPGWKFAVGSSWSDRIEGYRTLGLQRCSTDPQV